jgi:hypothetical protein
MLVNVAVQGAGGCDDGAAEINGEPGIIVSVAGTPFTTLVLAGGPEGIDHLWIVSNPDKLAHLLT